MPRAQCYYEILGIPETATTDEVKKAYKKQALFWHPDKNQANLDEAHAKFQVILKAYETLSDTREREWYDRHKEQILSDGGKEAAESCLNLFQFFSSACYTNFDDSKEGFYTVYRNVFETIANEERGAMEHVARLPKNKGARANRSDDISESYPPFGDSQSDYDDIVRPFYAIWSGFCTNLTFDFMDKYNTLEAENRRIVRAMEKENKKIKDAARKERNTNVRNLIEFVKKRDKRLKAHKLLVERQNELNRQKTAEKRRQQRHKLQETDDYKSSAYLDIDDVEEQLRQLECDYMDLRKSKRSSRRKRNQLVKSDDEDAYEGAKLIEGETLSETMKEDAQGAINDEVGGPDDEVAISSDRGGRDDAYPTVDDEKAEEEEEETFYCVACNKEFRTMNALENHEGSKKHKQNVQKLAQLLKAEEDILNK